MLGVDGGISTVVVSSSRFCFAGCIRWVVIYSMLGWGNFFPQYIHTLQLTIPSTMIIVYKLRHLPRDITSFCTNQEKPLFVFLLNLFSGCLEYLKSNSNST